MLVEAATFLAAAVVAVPVFQRLGLGSVLGYLAAGVAIGPFGLALIADPDSILRLSEFGVVLLLFLIGLELKPARLWSLRGDIFALGLAQLLLTGGLLAAAGLAFGLSAPVAVVAGLALALSSTAFALQILDERGERNTAMGTRAFSILLLQDLAIVPLLALVGLLAAGPVRDGIAWQDIAIVLGTLLGFIVVGKLALNPALRLIARCGSSEIFAAAALLLVIGAALLMAQVGLSMALGAFLAGVLLADSEYRHQLEADIQPYRSLLLGLFFMAVGMSVDWLLVLTHWPLVLAGVIALLAVKGGVLFLLCRLFGSSTAEALRIAAILPQGGEFAFVLFSVAVAQGLMAAGLANLLTAGVTLSMAATPLVGLLAERLLRRMRANKAPALPDGPEAAEVGEVIVAGFGRVGQIVAQLMAARGIGVTAVDHDPGRIDIARRYGNKVYFGDVRRLDVLEAAGAADARAIFLCVDDPAAVNEAVDRLRGRFPNAALLVRAFDRNHVLQLMQRDVDDSVRETFESSIALGLQGLRQLGVDGPQLEAIEQEFRRRDRERLAVQQVEGEYAGSDLVFTRYDDGDTRAD